MRISLLLPFSFTTILAAQSLPQIDSGGIVNAASYAQPIVSGAIVSIFGSNLAPAPKQAEATPLPLELGGTTVTVYGVAAPLLFVSPAQINIEVPWKLTAGNASVVVTTAAGSSSPASVPLYFGAPSFFAADSSGCGQAVAQNITPSGDVSTNSPSNSAAPGDYITLYGTGFGLPRQTPADGAAPGVADSLAEEPGLTIDGKDAAVVLPYAGLSPTLPGVNQINFQIPAGTREACSVPLTPEESGYLGPTLSISVHPGRGHCVDPPVESYGSVTLTKTVTTTPDGATMNSETLRASFPSAPGLQRPAPVAATPPDSYSGAGHWASMSRTCAVNGHTELSAGTLQVKPPSSSTQAVQASPTTTLDGVAYQAALPDGFLQPGAYSISATGAAAGSFQSVVTLPPPLQVQPLVQGTVIPQDQPLVIHWTGGAAGDLVKLAIVGQTGPVQVDSYAIVDAAAGSFTFTPICSGHSVESGGNGVICTFGPPGNDVTVVVEEFPASGSAATADATGITQGVAISYDYRYAFAGLQIK